MLRVRATFKKTGRAKYISHLDLNRCMLRTFRRSGLPIWYTEGFNPHPYYAFALALSLGFESECEILDFNITDDNMSMEEIRDRLNVAYSTSDFHNHHVGVRACSDVPDASFNFIRDVRDDLNRASVVFTGSLVAYDILVNFADGDAVLA